MRKQSGLFIVFVSLFILLCQNSIYCKDAHPLLSKGVIDLRGYNFSSEQALTLKGDCQFYWNQLVDPKAPFSEQNEYHYTFEKLNTTWNNYGSDMGSLPDFGHATFRLRLLNLDKNRDYGLLVSKLLSYKLFIDGKCYYASKYFSTTEPIVEAAPFKNSYTFRPIDDTTEIIFHISNHFLKKHSGFSYPLQLGLSSQISEYKNKRSFFQALLVGILLIVALCNLILFMFQRDKKYFLFFSLCSICITIRSALIHENFLDLFIQGVHGGLYYKVLILATIYSLTTFILFLYYLFPDEFKNKISKSLVGITLVLSILILLFPMQFVTGPFMLFFLFEMVALIGVAYIFINFIRIVKRKREGGILLGVGFLILLISTVHTILVDLQIVSSLYTVSIGLAIFTIFQTFVLSLKSYQAVQTIKRLNVSLIEMDKIKQELVHTEKLATMGTLVASVAHEVNNPNNSILLSTQVQKKTWDGINVVIDRYMDEFGDFNIKGYSLKDVKEEIPKSINRVIRNAERIKDMVNDLRTYARKDSTQRQTEVSCNDLVKSALMVIEDIIKESTEHFKITLANNIPVIKVNARQIEQVIINVVKNACQAIEDKTKKITVSTSVNDIAREVTIQVTDEGIGMDEETVTQAFNPFFSTKDAKEGTGIGLPICKNIMKSHDGKLELDSKVGAGTTVRIVLPVGYNV